MSPVNFLQKDSGIRRWTPDQSSLFADASEGSGRGLLADWKTWLPLALGISTVVLGWGTAGLLNRSVTEQIAALEPDHLAFGRFNARLTAAQAKAEEQKKHIESFEAIFTSSVPAHPFAYYLQQSIPTDVNLKTVSLDQTRFYLCAYSSAYEPIEDFLDLIKRMPGVQPASVRFTRMSSDPAAQGASDGCSSLSPAQPVSASINGLFLPQTPTDLQTYYGKSNDLGQMNKIRNYNDLLESLKGGS